MKRGPDRRRDIRKLPDDRVLELILSAMKEHAPNLLAEKPGAGLESSGLIAVLRHLEKNVPNDRIKRTRIILRHFLRDLQKATGGKVVLPTIETYIRRDRSPFAGSNLSHVATLEELLALFKRDLSGGLNIPPESVPIRASKNETPIEFMIRRQEKARRLIIGRIGFSAIVNGGLLHQALASQLFSWIDSGFMAHGQFAWISFPIKEVSGRTPKELRARPIDPDEPVRRWLIDPVTLGLIRHWKSEYSRPGHAEWAEQQSLPTCIRAYLSHLNQSSGDANNIVIPGKYYDWLRNAAQTRLSLHLPQVLVNFLRSLNAGTSMHERSWWRVEFDQHLAQTQSLPDADMGLSESPDDASSASDSADGTQEQSHHKSKNELNEPPALDQTYFTQQDKLLQQMRDCFKHPTGARKFAQAGQARSRLANLLDNSGSEMAPVLRALCEWAAWRLSPRSSDGQIKPGSVTRYLNRIDKVLLGLVRHGVEINLDSENPDVWEELYNTVLDSISSDGDRSAAVDHLRSFHRFLMENRSAPPCNIAGESVDRPHPRVSVISETDYQRTLIALSDTGSTEYLRNTARMIVILMFRAALRPEEIVSLEFAHVQGVTEKELRRQTGSPEIYLKSTYRQGLKTTSAVRQIPLRWFLEEHELEYFRDFLVQRIRAIPGQKLETIPVFGRSLDSTERLATTAVFSHIGNILRAVTNDVSIVPYSLRHSCLTHLFRRLMDPYLRRTDNQHPFFRRDQVPREAIYSISTFAGHLDPEISLGTYIHSQEICAFQWLKSLSKDFPLGVWANLEGKAYVALTQRRHRTKARDSDSPEQWEDSYEKLLKSIKVDNPKKRPGCLVNVEPETLDERSVLHFQITEAHRLMMSYFRQMSNSSRASIFQVPEEEVRRIEKLALRVREKKSHFREIKQCNKQGQNKSKNHCKTTNREAPKDPPEPVKPSRERRSRIIRDEVRYKRLPPLYTGAQPHQFAPGLPSAKIERAEANRIFALLCKQAREHRDDRGWIINELLKPLQIFNDHFFRTGAALRFTDAESLQTVVHLLRRARIPMRRMEIKILSFPKAYADEPQAWYKELKKLVKSSSIRFARSDKSLSVSRKHLNFGTLTLRVLAPKPDEESTAKRSNGSQRERSGSGWRVGLTYASLIISGAASAGTYIQSQQQLKSAR